MKVTNKIFVRIQKEVIGNSRIQPNSIKYNIRRVNIRKSPEKKTRK